jgi:hypothetical protein
MKIIDNSLQSSGVRNQRKALARGLIVSLKDVGPNLDIKGRSSGRGFWMEEMVKNLSFDIIF